MDGEESTASATSNSTEESVIGPVEASDEFLLSLNKHRINTTGELT